MNYGELIIDMLRNCDSISWSIVFKLIVLHFGTNLSKVLVLTIKKKVLKI